MRGDTVPILVRFSSSAGLPDVAENVPDVNPRGIAVRFRLSDGTATDLVGHSMDGFPARTPEEFPGFLRAASGREAEPEAFQRFQHTHPAASGFVAAIPPTPCSFASISFSTPHGMIPEGRAGGTTAGRLHIGPQVLADRSDAGMGGPDRDMLTSEIAARVARGNRGMPLVLQLAGSEDRIDDIGVGRPPGRPEVVPDIPMPDEVVDQHEQDGIAFERRRRGTAVHG